MKVNTQIFKIGRVTWTIVEVESPDINSSLYGSEFLVFKDHIKYECKAGGSTFETETGACYAILNEYGVDD